MVYYLKSIKREAERSGYISRDFGLPQYILAQYYKNETISIISFLNIIKKIS